MAGLEEQKLVRNNWSRREIVKARTKAMAGEGGGVVDWTSRRQNR